MKYITAVVLMVLMLSSCKDATNGLTKSLALEIIKACEADRPVQVEKLMYVGNMTFHNGGTSLTELNYLKKLAKKGVIKLDSISSTKQEMSSSTRINTVYNIDILDANKKYIIRQKDNTVYVNLVYSEVQDVESIIFKNEARADVVANFKKVETPFYDRDFVRVSNLKDKPELFSKTVSFHKQNKSGWMSCHLKGN